MLIGVLSDTHDHVKVARWFIRELKSHNVEYIIHLGDIVSPFTLKAILEEKPPSFIAVYGNNCGERLLLRKIAEENNAIIAEQPHLIDINGRRILLIHGWGKREYTINLVRAFARSQSFDIILYGHTHELHYEYIGRTLIANPGESCGCLSGRMTALVLDPAKLKILEIVEKK